MDEDTNTVWFHYLLIKDPALLTDNRAQDIAVEASVEKKLIKNGQLAAYNDIMKDYIQRGVLKDQPEDEQHKENRPEEEQPEGATKAKATSEPKGATDTEATTEPKETTNNKAPPEP